MAAAQTDTVADPYSPKAAVQVTAAAQQQADGPNSIPATNSSSEVLEDVMGEGQVTAGGTTEATAEQHETLAGIMTDISEANLLQSSGQRRSDSNADSTTAVSRPSSSAGRRSASVSGSRPPTAESQQSLKRQSSSGMGTLVARNGQPVAARAGVQQRGKASSSGSSVGALQRPSSRNTSRSNHGETGPQL